MTHRAAVGSGADDEPHLIVTLGRWALGAAFVYLGLVKALHPVDFLKLVREYGVVDHHVVLNLIAAVLPWFEVFCGALLLLRVAARGTALALLVLLLVFTGLVASRAWGLHAATGVPFCAVRFDCGCGNGDVLICGKLLENGFLMFLSLVVLLRGPRQSLPPMLARLRSR